jgi:hypothetical protein
MTEAAGRSPSVQRSASELAESDLNERMRNPERGQDAGICPIRYKLWARGINGEYLVATTIGSYGKWHKSRDVDLSLMWIASRSALDWIDPARPHASHIKTFGPMCARKGIRNDLGTEDVLRTEIGPAGTGPGFKPPAPGAGPQWPGGATRSPFWRGRLR